jgi:large subunit ribosomal protein L19
MRNQVIDEFENGLISTKVKHPKFRPGDTLKVHYKLEEGASAKGNNKNEKKFRIQVFEGVCIRQKRGSLGASFTVRKIASNSVGVERIFATHSPLIERIDIAAAGRVKRSRLYYLRDLRGKSARIKSRRHSPDTQLSTITEGEVVKTKKKKKS